MDEELENIERLIALYGEDSDITDKLKKDRDEIKEKLERFRLEEELENIERLIALYGEDSDIAETLKKDRDEIKRRLAELTGKNAEIIEPTPEEDEPEHDEEEEPTPEDPEEELDDEEIIIHENPEEVEEDSEDKDKKKGDKKKDNKTKAGKTFWEIVHETNTENARTIPTILYRWSKVKPFKASLSIIAAPIKLGMKLIGKIGNVFTGAQRKKNAMQAKIDGLSQEDFETLKAGMTQQEIRQSKLNEIYLYAVQERLNRENNQSILETIQAGEEAEREKEQGKAKIAQMEEEYNNVRTSEERKREIEVQLEIERNKTLAYSELQRQLRNYEEFYAKQIYDFQDSIEGKSNRRMNIKGWFAGVFNPNNKKYVEKMAQTSKEMREAYERGDVYEGTMKREELDKIKQQYTDVKNPLKNIPFLNRFSDRIQMNRGDATFEKHVVIPSQRGQTKGREMMANIALVGAAINLYHQFTAPRATEQQVPSYNEIGKVSDLQTKSGRLMEQNAQDQVSQGIPLGHQKSMMENGGVVSANDASLHDMVTGAANQTAAQHQAAAQAANSQQAFNIQAQNAINIQQNLTNTLRNEILNGQASQYLARNGANFDYASMIDSMTKAMDPSVMQDFANFVGNLPSNALIVTPGAVNGVSIASNFVPSIADMATALSPSLLAAVGLTYKNFNQPSQIDFNDTETVRKIIDELEQQGRQEEPEEHEGEGR